MAKTGLFAKFEDGFYDAWAPFRPVLHWWISEIEPVYVFQVLFRDHEVRYALAEFALVSTKDLYGLGLEIGKATKRKFFPEGDDAS